MMTRENGHPSHLTIAIDGPAASGKSTIGFYLAEILGCLYLDTGVLYRAVTWAVQDRGIPIEDEMRVTSLAEAVEIEVSSPTKSERDGRQYTVRVAGRDVTWELRSPQVESAVSPVSAYPGVRAALTRRMRKIAHDNAVVMVGRDIGTVVLPEASLKLFVVASAEERARRRYLELRQKGKDVTYEEVLQGIRRRDTIDSQRETAPLRAATDAVVFDTTTLDIQEMMAQVKKLVESQQDTLEATQGAEYGQI
jgi:CMP/dCMP kinase